MRHYNKTGYFVGGLAKGRSPQICEGVGASVPNELEMRETPFECHMVSL